MDVQRDGEETCNHCRIKYNPRLNFGSWECLRHLQSFDAPRGLFPCCNIIGEDERARRLANSRIVGLTGRAFSPSLVAATRDDLLGCCPADHDLPELSAGTPWPPIQFIRIHLLSSHGTNKQAVDWRNILWTRGDYIRYTGLTAAEAPTFDDFEQDARTMIADTVANVDFYTYMETNIDMIRTGHSTLFSVCVFF